MNTSQDSPYEAPIGFIYAAERFRTLYSTAMSACIQKFNYFIERGDTIFVLPVTGLPLDSLRQVANRFVVEFLQLLNWPEATITVTDTVEHDTLLMKVEINVELLLLAAPAMHHDPLIEPPESHVDD